MVFSSSLFLLYFLPVFLLLYHCLGKKLKNYIILIASIFFYAWGAPSFVFLLVPVTVLDFFIVQQIHRSKTQKIKKQFLSLSIFINLGMLAYFKYANFFIENVNAVLNSIGIEEVSWTAIALPIGISFYTFQTLTYSIDVYRKVHPPLNKVTDYLLYIMSFPQMIAGPIVRFQTIAEQIVERDEKVDDKLSGAYRFCIGLAKKVLIANVMAEQADLIFNNDLEDISTATAWLGAFAYTFQIYFDFSGYSDMAIGLGKIMGFKFPENFNSPYTSKSISEFWRRWHITLGDFMREYLYIPLGGNRVKTKWRLFFNLWIVFLLSGLWHGASWNFVFWGAFHGFFLILDRLFLLKFLNWIGKIPAMIITFFIVVVGWVLFRLETAEEFTLYLQKMFVFEGGWTWNTIPAFYTLFVIAIFFSFLVSFKWGKKLQTFFLEKEKYNLKQHAYLAPIMLALFILSLSSITASGFNPFIYFRF